MATLGPNSATSGTTTAGLWGISWANPTNIATSNNVRTTYTFNGSGSNNATFHSFFNSNGHGFNLPSNAVIQGITATVEVIRTGGSTGATTMNVVQLTKDGSTRVGTNKVSQVSNTISTTEAVKTYGGAADLWGTTWTADEINASTFGVSVKVLGSTSGTNRVVGLDHITITVTYTADTIVTVDTSSSVQTQHVPFVANGSFYVAEVDTKAFMMSYSTGVNVPEIVPVSAKAFTQTGLDASLNIYYAKDTGAQFFTNVIPGNYGGGTYWSNPGNLLANDGSYATISPSGTTVGTGQSNQSLYFPISDLGMAPVPGTVKGIEVKVYGRTTGNTPSAVNIFGNSKTLSLTSSFSEVTLGSSTDNWGITDASLLPFYLVQLQCNAVSTFATGTVDIDYITCRVWYSSEEPYTVGYETGINTLSPGTTSTVNYAGASSGVNTGWTWSNVSNASAFDATYATSTMNAKNQAAVALVKPLSEFSGIPAGATIAGIQVFYNSSAGTYTSRTVAVRPTSSASYSTYVESVGGLGASHGYGNFTQAIYFKTNWAPGTWDSTGLVAFQPATTSFAGTSTNQLDYLSARVVYTLNPAEQIPALTFNQTERVPNVLSAAAVEIDTKSFTMTRLDANVKVSERVQVTPLATTMTRLVPNINAKAVIGINLYLFGQVANTVNVIVNSATEVDTKAFTQSAYAPNINAKTVVDVSLKTFAQTNLPAFIVEKQLIVTKAFTQTRLSPNVNEKQLIVAKAFTQTNLPAFIVEKQLIPTLAFVQTPRVPTISSSTVVDVLEFVQTALPVTLNAKEGVDVTSRAFVQTPQVVTLNAKEGVDVTPRAFVQSAPTLTINAKEIIPVALKAAIQTALPVTINARENVPVVKKTFAETAFAPVINAKTVEDVALREFSQSAFEPTINIRESVGVTPLSFTQAAQELKVTETQVISLKVFTQFAQVVNVKEQLHIGTTNFVQTLFTPELPNLVGVQLLNFVQTAYAVKTTEVINSIGPLEVVMTSLDVELPIVLRVETGEFVQNALEVMIPVLVKPAILAFLETAFAPNIFVDTVPQVQMSVSWKQFVQDADGEGGYFKTFTEHYTINLQGRERGALLAVPTLAAEIPSEPIWTASLPASSTLTASLSIREVEA